MPSVISRGLDYSARRLSGASIRRAGYTFVHRYLDFPGQLYPALNAAEVDDLQANGVDLETIFERTTSDPSGGFDGGKALAAEAVRAARACGLPQGTTIYMCADAWLSKHGIPVERAMAFLFGARPVLESAGYVIGAYGFADFVFAAANGGFADRFWLCGAQIPDNQVPPWLDVYQWNNGRVYVDGLECDLNLRYRPIAQEVDRMDSNDSDVVLKIIDREQNNPDGSVHVEAWDFGSLLGFMIFRAGRIQTLIRDLHQAALDAYLEDGGEAGDGRSIGKQVYATLIEVEELAGEVAELRADLAAERADAASFRSSVLAHLEGIQTGTGFTLADIAKAVNDDAHDRSAE